MTTSVREAIDEARKRALRPLHPNRGPGEEDFHDGWIAGYYNIPSVGSLEFGQGKKEGSKARRKEDGG